MIDFKKIINDIINEHLTISEAALINNCSVSSIKKYIKKLKDSSFVEDNNLYVKYLENARLNQKGGRVKGGMNGIRKTSISQDTIEQWYYMITRDNYTLREIERISGVSSSNIYDCLIKYLDDKKRLLFLQEVFYEHHRNSLNDYNNDIEHNGRFHKEGSLLSRKK